MISTLGAEGCVPRESMHCGQHGDRRKRLMSRVEQQGGALILNILFPGYSPNGALHFFLPLRPERYSLSVEHVHAVNTIK